MEKKLKIDFRKKIRDAFERQGKTIYQVGKEMPEINRNALYRYMRGEKDMNGQKLAEVLSACGIELKLPRKIKNAER